MRITHECLADCAFDKQLPVELFELGRVASFDALDSPKELCGPVFVALEEADHAFCHDEGVVAGAFIGQDLRFVSCSCQLACKELSANAGEVGYEIGC